MISFIREERKRQRMSIRELSELSGITVGAIRHWEYGGVMPTVDNFQKVLNALGYDLYIVKKEKGDDVTGIAATK